MTNSTRTTTTITRATPAATHHRLPNPIIIPVAISQVLTEKPTQPMEKTYITKSTSRISHRQPIWALGAPS